MKAISDLKQLRDDLLDRLKQAKEETIELKRGEKKKIKNKIELLNTCIMYLDSNPTDEFVKKEITRLGNRIKLINDSFNTAGLNYATLMAEKTAKKVYEKEYDVPKLKKQLATLKFLNN